MAKERRQLYEREKAGLGAALRGIVPGAATAVMVGWFLPDTIPAHYGVSGQVDRWGSKYECFVLPGITLAFGALMLLAAWGASRSKKEDAQKGLKATLITGAMGLLVFDAMTAFFLYTSWAKVEDLGKMPEGSIRWLLGLIPVFLIVAGALMPRFKRNYWIGVRTKWTLQSDAVWEKSQRFGGKAFVVAGVLCLVGMFLPPAGMFAVFILSVGAAAVASIVYARREGLKEQSGKMDHV